MEFENTDYDLMLFNAIKNIDNLDYRTGGEGTAYFLDNNFVIKRYENLQENQELFYENFNFYCQEMQNFAHAGFPVPQIFSWMMVPAPPESHVKNYCYILEQRVKGRDLFFDSLDSSYSLMQNICSEDEYYKVINEPDQNPNLFKEIVQSFVKDYIAMNEYIASMPEEKLGSFLKEIYNMLGEGEFSLPDFYPSNVIIDHNDFTMIDNTSFKRNKEWETKEYIDSFFWSGIVSLFLFNENISKPQFSFLSDYKNFIPELGCLRSGREQNLKECKEAILRVVRLANKYCDKPELTKLGLYECTLRTLENIFPKEGANEIISEMIVD